MLYSCDECSVKIIEATVKAALERRTADEQPPIINKAGALARYLASAPAFMHQVKIYCMQSYQYQTVFPCRSPSSGVFIKVRHKMRNRLQLETISGVHFVDFLFNGRVFTNACSDILVKYCISESQIIFVRFAA